MQTITLKASARKIGTKQDLKKIRRAGDVPCIIYGNGTEHVDVAVSLADIKKLTDTPKSYIVNIDVDGKVYVCKLHDVQYHPITDNAIHVDFLSVSDKKPVEIAVPLNIHGNAEGVKQGGRLIIGSRKVKVSGPMDKLPDTIDVDVTSLAVGKTVYAGELKVDGCTVASPKKMMLCEVRYTRNVLTPEEEASTAGTTPAEGAAAPAAEGAAASAAAAPAAEKKEEKKEDKKKK
ncbi:MAG: 50S ribosomal protein L25 [Bacteroidales bacterium]|nr:50S ribosomal protein L25 [Bacteroidales bacterium]